MPRWYNPLCYAAYFTSFFFLPIVIVSVASIWVSGPGVLFLGPVSGGVLLLATFFLLGRFEKWLLQHDG